MTSAFRSAAGLLALIALLVGCEESPSGPAGGALHIEISGLPDQVAAAVVVSGPNGFSHSLTRSESLVDLAPGVYRVSAGLITAGEVRFGPQRPEQEMTVGGEVVHLDVHYLELNSSLTIRSSGLPAASEGEFRVSGPSGFSESFSGSRTLAGLIPGEYRVEALGVVAGDSTYQADPATARIVVVEGGAAELELRYGAIAPGTFNLSLATAYLVQAVQTQDGAVPLVAGRDAYLRVFVRASHENRAKPELRVRLYHGSALEYERTLPLASGFPPVRISEADRAGNWNVPIPGSLIRSGLRVEVTLDPGNAIAETDESDNSFNRGDAQRPLRIEEVAPLKLRFVPIRHASDGRTGRIDASNLEQYLTMARKIFPLQEIDAELREVYTTGGAPLDRLGGAWEALVSELDALRVAEGSDRYYYGVVQTPYAGGGVVGIAADIPSRTALGWDRLPDAANVFAHELGHNFGRRHSPCGAAAGSDPQYPYISGMIGHFGMDVQTGAIKAPNEFTDIMGYCDASWWISDYTFNNILHFRAAGAAPRFRREAEQPVLLVWGRVSEDRLVLEPAFQLVTRPRLPVSGGPYRIEARSRSGELLTSVAFSGDPLPDRPGDARIFSFAIPLAGAALDRLETLTLSGPGGSVTRAATLSSRVRGRLEPFANLVSVSSRDSGIELRWDAAEHSMVMVRDPETGAVLAFARDGQAQLPFRQGSLELLLSDGVRSEVQSVLPGAE